MPLNQFFYSGQLLQKSYVFFLYLRGKCLTCLLPSKLVRNWAAIFWIFSVTKETWSNQRSKIVGFSNKVTVESELIAKLFWNLQDETRPSKGISHFNIEWKDGPSRNTSGSRWQVLKYILFVFMALNSSGASNAMNYCRRLRGSSFATKSKCSTLFCGITLTAP